MLNYWMSCTRVLWILSTCLVYMSCVTMLLNVLHTHLVDFECMSCAHVLHDYIVYTFTHIVNMCCHQLVRVSGEIYPVMGPKSWPGCTPTNTPRLPCFCIPRASCDPTHPSAPMHTHLYLFSPVCTQYFMYTCII